MPRKQPLSHLLPHMRKGNMPDGATPLTFTSSELDDFLAQYPEAKNILKPYMEVTNLLVASLNGCCG